MKLEKAIMIMENEMPSCGDKITFTSEERYEAYQMAIDALRKQTPKQPNYEADGYDDSGELNYDTWICPCCGHYYEIDYEAYKFCPKCGHGDRLK